MRSRLLLPLLFLAPLLVGCDTSSKAIVTHKVTGQIFYDNKPAGKVQVYLLPTSAPTIPEIPANPHGITKEDGTFTITTFTEGDGAAEGGYQIILVWPEEVEPDAEATTDRLLGWYDAAHSKLTAQIKPGENALPPIKVVATKKLPDEVEGIPGRN